ncbi:hemoglobin subunit beta-2-like [Danio aesculapii]|uniref:hemoglobin subunit beta-2-like n=1 Tax=Danio aesculapii TaxID=1142201 RepID=UPI0024BFAC11|nr:hemoglobin subunit beta-2-like [Danio aesculapii]
MVVWTDFEKATIQDIFAKADYDVIGPQALARCLIVYPWTQRYFAKFGNLYNAAAILGNPMVAAHGKTVLQGLELAVKNMDNIKATYADLSVLHSEKLHVDPDNFRVNWPSRLQIIWVLVSHLKSRAASFQKFIAVAVSALGRQYH